MGFWRRDGVSLCLKSYSLKVIFPFNVMYCAYLSAKQLRVRGV